MGEGAVWVLQSGRISRIDPMSARITGAARLPGYQVAQVAAGEGAVWATMQLPSGPNVLVRIDPRTLRRTKTDLDTEWSRYWTPNYVAVGRGAVWWADSGNPGTV